MKRTLTFAAALLATGIAGPVLGQPAIGEPGFVTPPQSDGASSTGALPDPAYGTVSFVKLDVASFGFTPLNDGFWGHFNSGWSNRSSGNNSATCMNIQLPSGALLSGITTYTNDTDATGDITYTLYVFDMMTSTSTTPFTFTTSGTPGIERVFRTGGLPITINNDHVAYTLCVFHSVLGSTNQNAGATFWYKLQVSPAPAVATFTDVPTSHPFFRFVEALAAAGITGGCGAGLYCPNSPVTRGQMAVFLSVALGLHFPN